MERDAAIEDTMAIPQQEPHNAKTMMVFMRVVLADRWIASDQTGRFPRVSNRRNKYIAVFYVYDANSIKGIPVKSRHKTDLMAAYKKVYRWCEARGYYSRRSVKLKQYSLRT